MTPEIFKQYLDAMRKSGIMQFSLKLESLEMSGAFSAEPASDDTSPYSEPLPGGWKTQLPPNLDMPLSALDADEVE